MPASSHSKINALARGDTEVRQCFSPDELVLSYRTLILPKQTSDTGATPIEGSCPHKRKNTHTGTRAAGQVPAPRTCGHLPCRFQPCLGRAKSSPYHSFSVSGCCCSAPPSAASACADPSSRRCQRLAGGGSRVSRILGWVFPFGSRPFDHRRDSWVSPDRSRSSNDSMCGSDEVRCTPMVALPHLERLPTVRPYAGQHRDFARGAGLPWAPTARASRPLSRAAVGARPSPCLRIEPSSLHW